MGGVGDGVGDSFAPKLGNDNPDVGVDELLPMPLVDSTTLPDAFFAPFSGFDGTLTGESNCRKLNAPFFGGGGGGGREGFFPN